MNRRILKTILFSLSLITLFVCVFASVVVAQTPPPAYSPLALPQTGNIVIRQDLTGLFLDIFKYTIAASAALAILQIIIGGVQYMSTEAWSGKGNSKERIQQAIIGLLLVMLCFLILQTIDPRIVNISFLNGIGGSSTATTPNTQTPVQQPKWCVPTFRNDTDQGFNYFSGFDCSKGSQQQCEADITYYTTGPAQAWCIALFRNDLRSGYKVFTRFDCSKSTSNECMTDTRNYYYGDNGPEAQFCVAVFNKDGTFREFDCLSKKMADCKNKKIPYWQGSGYLTKGTLNYPGGTSESFDGCFSRYSTDGTLKYSTGELKDFSGIGCFQKYTTSGEIPGRGETVSGCVIETEADQLRPNN